MAAPTPNTFSLTGFTKIMSVKPPAVEMGSYDDTIDTDTQQSTQANGVLQSTEMTVETRQDGTGNRNGDRQERSDHLADTAGNGANDVEDPARALHPVRIAKRRGELSAERAGNVVVRPAVGNVVDGAVGHGGQRRERSLRRGSTTVPP